MERIISERGVATVTLISIIIAVVIMSIIVATITARSSQMNNVKSLDYMYNDIRMLNEKIAVYYFKYKTLPVKGTQFSMGGVPEEEINPNDNNIYYEIDLNALENLSLNNNPNDPTNIYVINEQSHTIYFPNGVIIEGIAYYRLPEEYSEIEI